MSVGGGSKELLNVLGEVKARVQDKLGIVGFPLPQFIVIGKQSVGKSRLNEALAGECFNFISGTLGSRRPTVLEFRHVDAAESKWYMRDRVSKRWLDIGVKKVMEEVGKAHEELGESVSEEPVYVRVESPRCVDMSIVDLPGFRDFAMDAAGKKLQGDIEQLVMKFMRDENNVMLCVEQAGDASTMSTLARCREIDPDFKRTILIRNKLDKYYTDLTASNANRWVQGFEDLPEDLTRPYRFALTLPFWKDGQEAPRPFTEIREENDRADVETMKSKGLSDKYMKFIGFSNFAKFMEKKIEQCYGDAIAPVVANLQSMKVAADSKKESLTLEYELCDPTKILSTTRDCGVSFATALTHVMEGVLELQPVSNLEDELRAFAAHHEAIGSTHFFPLPNEDFAGLDDYIDYLRNEIAVASFDVELNGGAQYRRMMAEVEIFLRFSEIAVETKKKDVIQARGISMSSLTWRDVVVKLLSNEAHLPLQKRVAYVGERIRWFFESQKLPVLEFMDTLEGTPKVNLFSPLYPTNAKLIKQNEMIKHLVFTTYDKVAERQYHQFIDLFDNMLTSTFSNPWVFLKGGAPKEQESEDLEDAVLPSFDDTKERIPQEIGLRNNAESLVSKWLQEIPTDPKEIDTAVDKVQMLVLKTYSFIRSQVCDQVELFAESFFKLPMLRRLEEDMAQINLSEEDQANYAARRAQLGGELEKVTDTVVEVSACLERLDAFRLDVSSMEDA